MEILNGIQWENTVKCNTAMVKGFTKLVNQDPELKAHRDYIESAGYGFGERAFHWAWKLLVDAMPQSFHFLEIGVYKGQILSLVRLLADRTGRDVGIVGVTPLSTFSGVTGKFPKFPEGDYAAHIRNLHIHFGQAQPVIIQGDSTDTGVVAKAQGEYDIMYIDGCHEFEYVMKDIRNYTPMVKPGGYLVMDDSSNNLNMPWGYFCGIEDVSKAVGKLIEPDPQWHHLFACMHLRIFQKMQDA